MSILRNTIILFAISFNIFSGVSSAFAQNFEWIFYSDDSANIIGKARLDGTEHGIVLSGVDAKDIALDSTQQKVYWIEGGTEIKRANVDGSNIESVVSVNCTSITVSSSRGVLLWINSNIPKKVEGLRLSDNLRFDFLTLPEGASPIQVMAGRSDYNLTVLDSTNGAYFLDINVSNNGGTLTNHISEITSAQGLQRSSTANFVYTSLITGEIFVRSFYAAQQTVFSGIIGPTEINYIYQSNLGQLFFINKFGPNISSLDLTPSFYGYNLTPVITGISNPTGFALAKALDFCPADPLKTEPGDCGCGALETDSDSDGVANCIDQCPNNAIKTVPGICGCAVADTDSDSDGAANCIDQCPNNSIKVAPGVCGCSVIDVDSDNDGFFICNDSCDLDPNKTEPGVCGCGVQEFNSDHDSDGIYECLDQCDYDPNKTIPGICGCGVVDQDSDGDGVLDCHDTCPQDPESITPSECGCGQPAFDSDSDGLVDCLDQCPQDGNKEAPGFCGCGVSDTDSNNDGILDCKVKIKFVELLRPLYNNIRVTMDPDIIVIANYNLSIARVKASLKKVTKFYKENKQLIIVKNLANTAKMMKAITDASKDFMTIGGISDLSFIERKTKAQKSITKLSNALKK